MEASENCVFVCECNHKKIHDPPKFRISSRRTESILYFDRREVRGIFRGLYNLLIPGFPILASIHTVMFSNRIHNPDRIVDRRLSSVLLNPPKLTDSVRLPDHFQFGHGSSLFSCNF
jgi:hypothetical protein